MVIIRIISVAIATAAISIVVFVSVLVVWICGDMISPWTRKGSRSPSQLVLSLFMLFLLWRGCDFFVRQVGIHSQVRIQSIYTSLVGGTAVCVIILWGGEMTLTPLSLSPTLAFFKKGLVGFVLQSGKLGRVELLVTTTATITSFTLFTCLF